MALKLKESNNKKYEKLMDDIGGFGKFQKRLCLLLVLSTVPNGYFALALVFVGQTPSYRCLVPDDYTLHQSSETSTITPISQDTTTNFDGNLTNSTKNALSENSHNDDNCLLPANFYANVSTNQSTNNDRSFCPYGIVYGFEEGRTSIVTEWDLICSRSWIKPLIITIYMSGALVGSLLSGALSDNIGRKPTFLIGTLLMFLALALCGLATSPAMFTVFMFIAGVMGFVNYNSAFTIASEMINSKDRVVTGTLTVGGFAGGYMLLPAFAYLIGNWRILCAVLGALGLVFIPYIWVITESPRWLYSRGDIEKLKKLIAKIALMNGLNNEKTTTLLDEFLSTNHELNEVLLSEEKKYTVSKSHQKRLSYLDLFRTGAMRSRTLIMWFVWFVCSVVYYCVALNTSDLGGNTFINCFVAAAVEIPAYAIVIGLLKWRGRKPVLIASLLVAGLACASVPFIKQINNDLSIAMAMIGKLAVTGSFAIVFIISSELFPTLIRSMGVGSSSMSARIGGMIAPYILYLGKFYASAPFLIMGVLAVLACALSTLLPETMDKPLPETIGDISLIQMPCVRKKKTKINETSLFA